MALRLIQGWDAGFSGSLEQGWSSSTFASDEPRLGTKTDQNSSLNNYFTEYLYTLPISGETVVIGGAVKLVQTGEELPNSSSYNLMSLRGVGSEGIAVRVENTYRLRIQSTFSTSVYQQVTDAVLAPGSWNYLELKAKLHLTEGLVEVRLNGVTIASYAGKTVSGTTGHVARVGFGAPYMRTFWDDCYALDTTGTDNNDFLGDVRVGTLVPNNNGDSSQWVGSDGDSTDNYLRAASTSSFNYVESDMVGAKDLYAMSNFPEGNYEIYGVQPAAVVYKDDSGAREAALLLKEGGVEVASSVGALTTSNRMRVGEVHETRPGGGAWTVAALNDMQVGPTVTS